MHKSAATTILVFLLQSGSVNAQDDDQEVKTRPSDGIVDNSFLIEEAFNQEPGVVQHIFTANFGVDHHPGAQDRTWDFSFTQEWPVFTQKHQLSYTIPYSFTDPPDAEHSSGLGDISLNYRYQVFDGSDNWPAFSPRLSLIFPSGDDERGFSDNAFGYQINLPVSMSLGDRMWLHLNAGVTHLPAAEVTFSNKRQSDSFDLLGFNLGASVIYALTQDFNVLVELLWNSNEVLDERSRGRRTISDRHRIEEFLVSPGIRWAHNMSNGLQLVPGIGLPIGLSDDSIDYGVFLYLSIEHPFVRSSAR